MEQFRNWLRNLQLQTLTDELKEEIIDQAEIMVNNEVIKAFKIADTNETEDVLGL